MKKLLVIALILVVSLTIFAACRDTGAKHLDAVDGNSISYDGSVLSWGAVANAECYYVYVGDSDEYLTVQTNAVQIEKSEDVKFSILAVADNEDYISAETKGSASFTYLKAVESISVVKRVDETAFDQFAWSPVDGADYYLIQENGSSDFVRYSPTDLYAEKFMQPIGASLPNGGQASLRVLPCNSTDTHTFSHWSPTKTVTVLATPSDFSYNAETNLISWAHVDNASYYRVFVGEATSEASASSAVVNEWTYSSLNAYVYAQNNDTFKFWVKAFGDYSKDILDSRIAPRSFQRMAPVDGLRCTFGELKWNNNVSSDSYELRLSTLKAGTNDSVVREVLLNTVVNGTIYQGDLNQFIGDNDNITLTASVRPVIPSREAEDIVTYAYWTDLEFSLLKAPTLEYRGGHTVAWTEITGDVSAYEIFINYNGVNILAQQSNAATRQYEYDFTRKAGTYEVRVVALASNETALQGEGSSSKSNPIYFKVLGAPNEYTVYSNSYDAAHDVTDLENHPASDVNFYFNDVVGADTYSVSSYYGFAVIDENGDGEPDGMGQNLSEKTSLGFETIDYRKTAGDDQKKGDQTFTINSFTADADGFTRTVYISARSTLDGKYVVFDEQTNRFVSPGEGKISDTIVLNGYDAMPIVLEKLASPTGVSLSGNELTWNRVAKASGYLVKIVCMSSGEIETQFVQTFNTRYVINLTTAGAYDIYLCALGNDNVILNSIYTDPIHVMKLPAVTGLTVTGDGAGATVLDWEPTEFQYNNVTYSPKGYEVRIQQHFEYLNEVNMSLNSSLSLANYMQYFSTAGSTCTVRALGDNINEGGMILLDSDECSSITIFKLPRPTSLVASAEGLAWAGVANAQGYQVFNKGTLLVDNEITKNTTSFMFSRRNLGLDDPNAESYYGGASFEFTVRAIRTSYAREDIQGAYYVDSEVSAMRAISVLPTPEVEVDPNTGVMSWKRIPLASSYLVKIGVKDAEPYSYVVRNDVVESNTITHTPTIIAPDGAVLDVTVTAIGDGISYVDSFAYAYSTSVQKLAPVVTKEIEGVEKAFTIEVNETDGKATSFTITVLDALEDDENKTMGRGYYVNIGGVDVFVDKSVGTYTVNTLAVGEYEIKVCAVGGNYDPNHAVEDHGEDNTIYINSDYSATQTIYVLAAPAAANVYVSTGGLADVTKRVVSFKEVAAAAGYKLTYTYKKYVPAATAQEQAHYDVIGTAQTMTINVGDDEFDASVNVQGIKDGQVNFILSGIDSNVSVIEIIVTVLGDGETTITSESSTKTYDVR